MRLFFSCMAVLPHAVRRYYIPNDFVILLAPAPNTHTQLRWYGHLTDQISPFDVHHADTSSMWNLLHWMVSVACVRLSVWVKTLKQTFLFDRHREKTEKRKWERDNNSYIPFHMDWIGVTWRQNDKNLPQNDIKHSPSLLLLLLYAKSCLCYYLF